MSPTIPSCCARDASMARGLLVVPGFVEGPWLSRGQSSANVAVLTNLWGFPYKYKVLYIERVLSGPAVRPFIKHWINKSWPP